MSDSLAGLRNALAPKPGLKPIPLASQAYQLTSVAAAATRTLNVYPEKLPAEARSPFILKPVPGLDQLTEMSRGPVLASAAKAGMFYAISGDRAYWMADTAGAPTHDLGTVGTVPTSSAVTIAIGITGVVFCVPPRCWVASLDAVAPTFQEITTGTGNFPAEGASSVCFIDGYWIFTSANGEFFFTSKLLDPLNFDSLDYTYLNSDVDYLEHCVAHNGELWIFGQNAVRVWYDSGNANAPFRARTGGVIPHGIGARRTIVELDGSVWWLGVDGCVYRNSGYNAQRVSTHALELLLADYDGGYLRTAVACGFMHEGHAFYALSLPNAGTGRTFVYDCATQLWHERSSATNGVGRWEVNTATRLGGRTLLGSSIDGRLFVTKTSLITEAGDSLPWEAILPPLVTHGPRAFMSRLEVEMETGTALAPGSLGLAWSDDGGITFNTSRTLSTGAVGATRTRVAATRLGSFRQRVLKLSGTGQTTIYGVDADVKPGQA